MKYPENSRSCVFGFILGAVETIEAHLISDLLFWGIPVDAQDRILVLCSGTTPGGAWGSEWGSGDR